MIEAAVDRFIRDIGKHLGENDFWFEWRGLFGKERLIYEKDIKQRIIAWSNTKKIIVSWNYDDMGYNTLVSSGDDPNQKARILGGVTCERREAFEAVYDLFDHFWNRHRSHA